MNKIIVYEKETGLGYGKLRILIYDSFYSNGFRETSSYISFIFADF